MPLTGVPGLRSQGGHHGCRLKVPDPRNKYTKYEYQNLYISKVTEIGGGFDRGKNRQFTYQQNRLTDRLKSKYPNRSTQGFKTGNKNIKALLISNRNDQTKSKK